MYRSLIVALACFLPLAVTATDAVPAPVQTGLAQIREADLRADIGFLASDAMKGRLAMEQGDDIAVQWVVSEFTKAGLKPAATDAQGKASFLQPVPLIAYSPDSEATRLVLVRKGKHSSWKTPEVSGRFPADLDVHAPVVFAGYGITDPGLHYDDYANVDVKGRIVVVFTGEPQENDPNSIFNGNGNTRNAAARVKLLTAQAHGAVAVLIAPVPSGSAMSPMQRSARYANADKGKPHPEHATFALADDQIHIPSMLISSEVMTELLATSGSTPVQLQMAIDKDLKPESRALPDTEVSLHFASRVEKKGTTWNVAGLLQGSDPALAAETIIISGHHDHHGENKDGAIFHGADDNASGTAGVVALAHAFMANPARPKRSILFVVFGAEEPGLLGSYYMAAHPLRPLATTRAVINFDMIGRDEKPSIQTDGIMEVPADTSNRLNLIGSVYSPDYRRTVGEQNAHVGLVLDDRFDHDAVNNVLFRSDQFPFVLKNIPAFWWFTGFHPDYHRITDTAEKIDYAKMARILRLAYLSAWQFADGRQPPRFLVDPRGRAN
ncbi:MAG: M20/M25/M40 family metallo-hydrolase [Xanthomonadales bacterium]|nr:M20/M25/M40 family metallo-hydrolase [Xanthomonadales bacterium]